MSMLVLMVLTHDVCLKTSTAHEQSRHGESQHALLGAPMTSRLEKPKEIRQKLFLQTVMMYGTLVRIVNIGWCRMCRRHQGWILPHTGPIRIRQDVSMSTLRSLFYALSPDRSLLMSRCTSAIRGTSFVATAYQLRTRVSSVLGLWPSLSLLQGDRSVSTIFVAATDCFASKVRS